MKHVPGTGAFAGTELAFYGLYHPVRNTLHYIGITPNPPKRLMCHINHVWGTKNTKPVPSTGRWVEHVDAECGLPPVMRVLFYFHGNNPCKVENAEIRAAIDRGIPLLNYAPEWKRCAGITEEMEREYNYPSIAAQRHD